MTPTIRYLFEHIAEFRHGVMSCCSATDVSTFCYALPILLDAAEKKKYLDPLRDMPLQKDWIEDDLKEVKLVSKDIGIWLLRIRNPVQYWSRFERHAPISIWILAHHSLSEENRIFEQTRILGRDRKDFATGRDLSDNETLVAYIKLLELRKSLLKPPGEWVEEDDPPIYPGLGDGSRRRGPSHSWFTSTEREHDSSLTLLYFSGTRHMTMIKMPDSLAMPPPSCPGSTDPPYTSVLSSYVHANPAEYHVRTLEAVHNAGPVNGRARHAPLGDSRLSLLHGYKGSTLNDFSWAYYAIFDGTQMPLM